MTALDSGRRAAQDVAMETPRQLAHAPRSPLAWRWLRAGSLLAAGIVLGLAFAAYGGADLLLNISNLRYCG